MKEAGSILLAKTTMPDLGMLSSGLSTFHPLTSNPWNPAWNSGGSSAGGSAAAAAGYGPLHVGTDIGGSLRLPASWNGIVSLKPSNGRVPINPPYFGRAAGPLTRTVADAALLMSVLSLPDRSDYMSLPPADINWGAVEQGTIKGLRIGLHLEAGAGMPVEPHTHDAVIAAAKLFEQAGAIEPLPHFSADALNDLICSGVRGWVDYCGMPPEKQKLLPPSS